jgi:hypothetical protein
MRLAEGRIWQARGSPWWCRLAATANGWSSLTQTLLLSGDLALARPRRCATDYGMSPHASPATAATPTSAWPPTGHGPPPYATRSLGCGRCPPPTADTTRPPSRCPTRPHRHAARHHDGQPRHPAKSRPHHGHGAINDTATDQPPSTTAPDHADRSARIIRADIAAATSIRPAARRTAVDVSILPNARWVTATATC